jgi:hypothetical protein
LEKVKPVVKVNDEECEARDQIARLRPLILALGSFDPSTPSTIREDLLAELMVIAHHPRLAMTGIWLDLLRSAEIAPEDLVSARAGTLLSMLWSDASLSPSVSALLPFERFQSKY